MVLSYDGDMILDVLEAEEGNIDAKIASVPLSVFTVLASDSNSLSQLSVSFLPDNKLYPLIALLPPDLFPGYWS